jgi:hypothetical protein
MLLFWKNIGKTQMSKPPECTATFFKKLRSIYVGHLGLQSVTYRVDTPCMAQSVCHSGACSTLCGCCSDLMQL